MRLIFDIDGTICEITSDHESYQDATPYCDMVNLINEMYDNGHYIIVLTARGMGTCCGVVSKAYEKWYSKTEAQLKCWGLKYHELHLGKPHGDVYIDDKAFLANADGSSVDNLREFLKEKCGA